MLVTKKKNYTHIKQSQNSVNLLITEFKNRYSEFEGEHIIIDFSEKINTRIEELLLFLNISKQHRNNGTSFVLVCKGINIDEIPDEINIIPTFTEALDILEMDAIERDLGF
jgi:hypothetical protein